jgi:hypothetical protein
VGTANWRQEIGCRSLTRRSTGRPPAGLRPRVGRRLACCVRRHSKSTPHVDRLAVLCSVARHRRYRVPANGSLVDVCAIARRGRDFALFAGRTGTLGTHGWRPRTSGCHNHCSGAGEFAVACVRMRSVVPPLTRRSTRTPARRAPVSLLR